MRANVVRPSSVMNPSSPVLAKSTTRNVRFGWADLAAAVSAASKTWSTASWLSWTVSPSGTVTTAT